MFKRPAARESPKAMEPPAVSRFLYQANCRRRKSEYQGEFWSRNPFSLDAWLSRTISVVCSLLALFFESFSLFSMGCSLFSGKEGVGYLGAKFRLTKLVEITTSFACS